MRVLTGVDALEIARLREALAEYPRLGERLFCAEELAYAKKRRDPVPHLAARFAAKEAVGKLLGCGVGSWHDIVVQRAGGSPTVALRGRAALRAQALGVSDVQLSLTHTATMAVAVAVSMVRVAAADGQEVEEGAECRGVRDH